MEDEAVIASEPTSVYGTTSDHSDKLEPRDEFERDWKRSITIEEFSQRCDAKLKEMYGVS